MLNHKKQDLFKVLNDAYDSACIAKYDDIAEKIAKMIEELREPNDLDVIAVWGDRAVYYRIRLMDDDESPDGYGFDVSSYEVIAGSDEVDGDDGGLFWGYVNAEEAANELYMIQSNVKKYGMPKMYDANLSDIAYCMSNYYAVTLDEIKKACKELPEYTGGLKEMMME